MSKRGAIFIQYGRDGCCAPWRHSCWLPTVNYHHQQNHKATRPVRPAAPDRKQHRSSFWVDQAPPPCLAARHQAITNSFVIVHSTCTLHAARRS